jgi:hypothetical protein
MSDLGVEEIADYVARMALSGAQRTVRKRR